MLGGALVTYVPSTAFKFTLAPNSLIWAGMLVGLLIVVLGLFLWIQPQLRYLLSIAIVLLSLFSFITSDFGGFFLGMLMGLVGGSLAFGWMPNPPPSRRERRRELQREQFRRAALGGEDVELTGRPTSLPIEGASTRSPGRSKARRDSETGAAS